MCRPACLPAHLLLKTHPRWVRCPSVEEPGGLSERRGYQLGCGAAVGGVSLSGRAGDRVSGGRAGGSPSPAQPAVPRSACRGRAGLRPLAAHLQPGRRRGWRAPGCCAGRWPCCCCCCCRCQREPTQVGRWGRACGSRGQRGWGHRPGHSGSGPPQLGQRPGAPPGFRGF